MRISDACPDSQSSCSASWVMRRGLYGRGAKAGRGEVVGGRVVEWWGSGVGSSAPPLYHLITPPHPALGNDVADRAKRAAPLRGRLRHLVGEHVDMRDEVDRLTR